MSHVFVADLSAAAVGSHITLDSDEGHHAVRVRRVREGEVVELVDGLGTRATGVVSAVGKSECAVALSAVAHEPSLEPRLTVVQALVKRDRSDQAMELLTEAGVDTVVPWAAARSQSSEVPTKWPRIAAESSKQSRRARFPVIAPAHTTAAVCQLINETVSAGGVALLCHESAHTPIAEALRDRGELSGVKVESPSAVSRSSSRDGQSAVPGRCDAAAAAATTASEGRSSVLTDSDARTAATELDGSSGARGHGAVESPATADSPAAALPHAGVTAQDIIVVVGPEGGLTADELAAFTAAGAKPVVMGPSVMRAATAGAAAACIVSALTNRWRGRSPQ